MSRGSGAFVVHSILARALPAYRLTALNPRLEYCPPLMLACRRHAAPIMHVPPDYAALVTPRRSRLVVTFHGYFLDAAFAASNSLVQRIHYASDLRWFTRQSLRRADVVTAVSQHVADLVREDLHYRGDILVLPNGVDVSRFAPAPEAHEGVRILYCGNLSRRKGGHLLPDIARRLAPGVALWVASGLRGDRPAAPLPANCRMLGGIPFSQMPSLYNQADILLAPSQREGFGLSIAEAMACGLPVVASNCSAIPELVVAEQGGLLATPTDVDEFAAHLNRLAADASLRKRMGSFNRERIETCFNEAGMVEGYQRLFLGLG